MLRKQLGYLPTSGSACGTPKRPLDAGIQRLSQREVNQAVGELVRCHARETEFGVVDQPSDRRTLRRERNPTERDALPLPLRCDLKEVGVLREQHPPNRCCPREQLVVRHPPCGVFLRGANIDLFSTEAL